MEYGTIHPKAFGWARNMLAPYSFSKLFTISVSETLAACICAIFSLAGLEKWHSSMLQVATESGQPHWHFSLAPTRRTSTLGFSDAVCARAAAAIITTSNSLLV